MNKKLISLGIGFVAGALGSKVATSSIAKKLAVATVAEGMKAKESIDKTVENIKVSTEDIVAEAKVKKEEDEKKEAERKAKADIDQVVEEVEEEAEEVSE